MTWPGWVSDPSAANDPTAADGWALQHARADLRKSNALVQTPDFVADFILDRTLTPALETFGLPSTTVIDPACGTGHLLAASFMRLAVAWLELAPDRDALSTGERAWIAQAALMAVAGVDLASECVEIARARLAALATSLAGEEPGRPWRINVACADALLHGPDSDGELPGDDHRCEDPDCGLARAVLGCTYAAVVANPPYIAGARMGPEKSAAYRARYRSCHGAYSLSIPFMELCFALAHRGESGDEAGRVGTVEQPSLF